MKSFNIRICICLLAFFIAFVHGDTQAQSWTYQDIVEIRPNVLHQQRYDVVLEGAQTNVTLESLAFAVVETQHQESGHAWLPGYDVTALGAIGRFWRIACPRDVAFDAFLLALSQKPHFKHVFPDVIKPTTPLGVAIDDPKYPAQWYLAELEAELLWEKSFGDAAVKVAVIDSGIDVAHPDLQSKIIAPKD